MMEPPITDAEFAEFEALIANPPDWMTGKSTDLRQPRLYHEQLLHAIERIGEPKTPEQALLLVQLHMALQSVQAWEQAGVRDLQTLVWLGYKDEALHIARQADKYGHWIPHSLHAIYTALVEKGIPDPSLLDEIWATVRQIPDNCMRAIALCDLIIKELHRTTDPRLAEAAAEAAKTSRETQPLSNGQYDSSFEKVAETFVEIGYFNEALQLTEDERAEDVREPIYENVIWGLINAHQFDRARELMNRHLPFHEHPFCLSGIAVALAEVAPEQAKILFNDVLSKHLTTRTIHVFAAHAALVGDFEKALTLARQADWIDTRIAVAEIAIERDFTIFETFFEDVLEYARNVKDPLQIDDATSPHYSEYPITNIVRSLAKAGHLDHSLTIVKVISSKAVQVKALIEIAQALLHTSSFSRVIDLILSATQESPQFLGALALLMAKAGDNRAFHVYIEGLKHGVESANDRMGWLKGCIAEILLALRQLEAAQAVINTVPKQDLSPIHAKMMNTLSAIVYPQQSPNLTSATDLMNALNSLISETILRDQFEKLLCRVLYWHPYFESLKLGLTISVILEMVRIAGWLCSGYRDLHQLLVQQLGESKP